MHALNLRKTLFAVVAVILAFFLAGCEPMEGTSQQQEAENRQVGYDTLTERQPNVAMNYSPTRETINYWVETWDEPVKCSCDYQHAEHLTGIDEHGAKSCLIS